MSVHHTTTKHKTVIAADFLDQAHSWGHEDATEGNDQRGSAFYTIGSPAWNAYNEGYAEGCATLATITGQQRPCWLPTITAVSWNSGEVR